MDGRDLQKPIESAVRVLSHLPQIMAGIAVVAFLAGAGLVAVVLSVANYIGG